MCCGSKDVSLTASCSESKGTSFPFFLTDSMTMSMEGFGPDSVFTTPAEDNGQYRISRSLVRSAEGSTVPLTRVKCLVSMTTPHDIRLHGSAVTPAFVEFDTSLEGFGLAFHLTLHKFNVHYACSFLSANSRVNPCKLIDIPLDF